jgi:hypothetical protein
MEAMILMHESDGRAFALAAAGHERRLKVVEGRAWITRTQRLAAGPAPEDLWLAPGEQLVLPPGSAWVVQAVGPLRLRLCEPGLSAAPSFSARLAAAWRAWVPQRRPAL